MLIPNNSTSEWKTCPGTFWYYDDFENCHRQRYLEFWPMAIGILFFLGYTLISLFSRKSDPRFADIDPSITVFHPKDVPDDNAQIILRSRSVADRLRLVGELALNIVQLGLVVMLLCDPKFIKHYELFSPHVPKLYACLALYTLVLSIYRFVKAKDIKPLVAQPFTQLAFLYTLLLCVIAINWYSQFSYSYSLRSAKVFNALLVVAVANWLILFTSPIGDHAARLYTTRGESTVNTHPSTEPTSSLLTIMSCSWCYDMIREAQKKPMEQDDVLDLIEADHVYSILSSSKQVPTKRSFIWRLAFTLRKHITFNILFGCSASFLKLTPTLFIQRILRFLETRSVPKRVAWLYVFCLGLTYLLSNVCSNQAFYHGRKLSIGVRSLIVGNVYHKALYQRTAKTKKKTGKDSADGETAPRRDGSVIPDDNENTSGDESLEDSRIFDVSNTGAVINLMSIDAFKIAEFSAYMHEIPATPLLVLLSVGFLYTILGWSAFVAVAVMVAMTPANVILAKRLNKAQDELMAVTDRRVEKTNELLDAIRIVKYYAWERRFTEKLLKIRDEELNLLLWRYLYWIANGLLFFLVPILVVISSFWCYVRYQGGTLTTSVAFTALAVFNIMRMPLNELGYMFADFSSSIVSINRIDQYLNADETPKYDQLEYEDKDGQPEKIGFEGATFTWGGSTAKSATLNNIAPSSASTASSSSSSGEAFALRDITLKFIPEDLNVIVGHTGSGKTSLLLALLGEMKKEKGHVYLPDGDRRVMPVDKDTGLTNSVAYCPQEAWLVNDTIKNNILFAHKFNKKRYNDVLDACELRRDLEILDKGDQTLIGDKGIALSGGQKQRVSLARAIYSNSRHLILDDCLSAVDAHTAEALYNNALNGPLARNRTIILVSHNVALTIGKAALVAVLANGRIVAQGSPVEVSSSGHLGQDDLINRNAQSAAASRSQSVSDLTAMTKAPTESNPPEIREPVATLVADEENEIDNRDEESRAVGSVPLKTYLNFLREMTDWKGLIFVGILAVLVPAIQYGENLWVRQWAASSSDFTVDGSRWTLFKAAKIAINPRNSIDSLANSVISVPKEVDQRVLDNLRYYSIGYAVIGITEIFVALLREFIIYYGGLQAARRIFRKLLITVVHAKTRFHDSTPSGRIVNRFSKDMEVIDQEISANLLWFVISIVDALQVTLIISYVTPMLAPLAVIIVYLFYLIGKLYLSVARELKRLESVTRSPIFQQFGETLSGSVVIRAYGDTERFIRTNWKVLDQTHRPYFWLWLSNRWLSFWCSVLSLIVCVLSASFIVAASDHIDPGMAGISLSFATYFGDCILWIVRMYAQCEVSMNSVERVNEYLEIEQEAPGIIPESRPPVGWPSKGNIEFKKLSLQYADDLPRVINEVSFNIPGGKKVGIVGRTGAGKSTIITALLRMLEPTTGSIVIDDVDISTIGLEDLRHGISIIPQDPTLFKGSLRSNIDLFNEYSDDSIFKALSHAHLVPSGTTAASAAEAVAAAAEDDSENQNPFFDLSHAVSERGQNLSQGQRQLLCLARAILKEPRILLLDEATASIDYATDALIQETIRDSFKESTILTIAHRLRTIADYDLILVLERGEVAQFGHPDDLLQDKQGIFYGMCVKSGELESLVKLAKDAKKSKDQ